MHPQVLNIWLAVATCLFVGVGCAPLGSNGQKTNQTALSVPAAISIYQDSRENSVGMKFVQIPAGSFLMGSPDNELGRDQNELLHRVTLNQAFMLQTTEVTQGQWLKTMGSNPSFFSNCGIDCPVENISWNDAQKFIARLNTADPQYNYRLPTEAEWEYAARAGSQSALPNGELRSNDLFDDMNVAQLGWYVGNSQQGTHPVAQKPSNRWGLYDMHGNVREWCNDWHHIYPFTAEIDPQGPDAGWSKIRRGGSWNLYTRFLRSASRDWANQNSRDPFTGLRLVQYEKPPKPKTSEPANDKTAKLPRRLDWEILFDYDKAVINPSMASILTEVTAEVEKGDQLILGGHTCDIGTLPYNLMLSKHRVEATREYLTGHGIKESQLRLEFFGEENPAHPNETEKDRAGNRRVSIRIVPAP
ncbi:MAG TPA: SUMF1/EgtB/PvdO family nonheme iron enzyme [Malonomonas sp.]